MKAEENRNIGHAARAAEGRTLWIAAWKKAWDEADHAAVAAENRAAGPVESRRQWAVKIAAARDATPPLPSDAEWNEEVVPAWDTAWKAAWEAAIAGARVSLEERDKKELSGAKRWDKAGRAARAEEGLAAGAAAWNETYRAEIKKIN